MNEKVLKTLEYDKILNQLSEYACSPEAKKRCLALRPITDKAQIEQLQLQTKDALSRLFRCGNLLPAQYIFCLYALNLPLR